MYYRWREKRDPEKVDAIAGAASWKSRTIDSRSWSPSCSWTNRCSRTLQKKVVSPDQQRAAADYLSENYGISQREICHILGRTCLVLRYRRAPSDEPTLNGDQKVGPPTSAFLDTVWFMPSWCREGGR